MNKKVYDNNVFDNIKHINDDGLEFWYARELMKVLEYSKWENFKKVIEKAIIACEGSKFNTLEHFPNVRRVLKVGNNAEMIVDDYKLTRYACYMIAQNGDTRKETIALAQSYFAVQTRKLELITEKEYNLLSEDEKRFYQRGLTKKGNYSLNQAAKNVGVKNFDKFHNAGYKGLYNGETADDIAMSLFNFRSIFMISKY